jgi:hypothetical protein
MQVQLVFRTADGDYFVIRDPSPDFEAHVQGEPLGEGGVLNAYGRDWLIIEAEWGETPRFVCVPIDEA